MRPLIFLTAACMFALSGCASISPEDRRAADAARCKSYGFKNGSSEFARCLLEVDLDRAADRRAAQSRLSGGYGPGWRGYGRYGGWW